MQDSTKPAFTTVWTKETLERIREEYKASAWSFLCIASAEFEQLWNDYKDEIRALGLLFNETAATVPAGLSSADCLFYPDDCYEKVHHIRLAFLDHEINRLTKAVKPKQAP